MQVEFVDVAALKPHPKNYRVHPDDELEHIAESVRKNGFYRPIVVARGDVILAGHGVVEAATKKLGLAKVPVVRLDIDANAPEAMKVLIGDNEIGHLVEVDDRMLTDALRDVLHATGNLLGTGYDKAMLANLVFVTRPESEIRDFNEAIHWVGLPEFTPQEGRISLVLQFRSEEDRQSCLKLLGVDATDKTKTVWWPAKSKEDRESIRFEQENK